jgi:hypothetical protein
VWDLCVILRSPFLFDPCLTDAPKWSPMMCRMVLRTVSPPSQKLRAGIGWEAAIPESSRISTESKLPAKKICSVKGGRAN